MDAMYGLEEGDSSQGTGALNERVLVAQSSTAVKDRVFDLVGDLHGALGDTGRSQNRLLMAIAGLDKAHVWERDGHSSMAEWVSAHVGISQWAARRWITAGHALPLLPHICRAFESGELCLDKVLELCRFATAATEKDLLSGLRG